jgi:EAL domain-containing protein (putative c-di-GMP-specific phosphodiesterase class I)
VNPNAFIPLAETTGLIVPIGEWVLRQACLDALMIQEQGHYIQVSVNLSGRQFREEPLIDTIEHILLETGLDPTMLMLEITESVLMEHAESTVARLYRLKDMGIYLSIDDFGTGYSSMTYLKRFPVAKLKIDQSFIRDILDDSEDMAITGATVQMAHGLRLKVVAEGIETQAQAEYLREHGCDFGQGFLYSRPITLEDLLQYLKTGPAEN